MGNMMVWWAKALVAKPASLKTITRNHTRKRANVHRLSSGFHVYTLLRACTPPTYTSTHKSKERKKIISFKADPVQWGHGNNLMTGYKIFLLVLKQMILGIIKLVIFVSL